MRMWVRTVVLGAGLLAAGPGLAVSFPEPVDHLAVMKDLLAMPKPKNCTEAAATLDLEICSANAFRDTERALNRAYQAAARDLSDTARAKLRTSEHAWLVYRDAECGWRASLHEGGSLAPVSYGQCLVDLTRERVKAIEASSQP